MADLSLAIFLTAIIAPFPLIGIMIDRSSRANKAQGEATSREMRQIYLARGKHAHSIIKIGYSGRSDQKRILELERKSNIKLEIIAEIKCNYAWDVEQDIHRALRDGRLVKSLHRRTQRFGNEWYSIPTSGQASVFLIMLEITKSHSKKRKDFNFEVTIHNQSFNNWIDAARPVLLDAKTKTPNRYHYFEIENPNKKRKNS